MSIINFISNKEVTLVQGVDGLFFCEESWISQRNQRMVEKEPFNKEAVEQGNRSSNATGVDTDLSDNLT